MVGATVPAVIYRGHGAICGAAIRGSNGMGF